jgi:hypothetical protein
LACRALGLGTLITTNHILYEPEVRAILGLPDDVFTFRPDARWLLCRSKGRRGSVDAAQPGHRSPQRSANVTSETGRRESGPYFSSGVDPGGTTMVAWFADAGERVRGSPLLGVSLVTPRRRGEPRLIVGLQLHKLGHMRWWR